MIKKALILGVVALVLLSFSALNAVAAEGVIEDEKDDVTSEDAELNIEEGADKPNLDIDKLSWSRDGQNVDLTLTVAGSIEDKGSLEIFRFYMDEEYQAEKLEEIGEDGDALEEYFNLLLNETNFVTYGLSVETQENFYGIFYVNQEFLIKDLYSTDLIPGEIDVDGSDLTVSFELIDEGDIILNLSADTMDFTQTMSYMDDLLGEAESIQEEEPADEPKGSPGFEMIGVLAAIAIAFIIIRRKK